MIVHNENNLPTIPIADLLPTQGELKDLSELNYKKLKNTIDKRGFSVPVYVWEDSKGIKHLLDGHQRQRVLTTEGWDDPIPYLKVPAKNLQEAMARLLEITSQYGTITQEGIDEFIAKYDLPEAEIYEATHFDAVAFYDTQQVEPEVVEDEAPEVDESEPPKSKLGEVYKLGNHRIMCGDSASLEDMGKLLGDKRADLVFTDPPWNVNYGAVKEGNKQGYKPRTIQNDNMGEDFTPFLNSVFSTMNAYSKDGCMTYVVMSAQEWGNLMNSLKDNGYHWSSTIIWNKDHLVLSRKDYHTKYEPIWYGWKEGESRLHPLVDRKQSDVWDIDRPTRSEEHPTMKPIELCAKAITNSSSKNDVVLDQFLGSGSTLIACEQTERVCYGMELDPKYCDVIRKRWAKYVKVGHELPENWEELTPAITGK